MPKHNSPLESVSLFNALRPLLSTGLTQEDITHPDMTEKLLTGTKNQNKQKVCLSLTTYFTSIYI